MLTPEDWNELRIAADWRLWKDLKEDNPLIRFGQYFDSGLWSDKDNEDKPLPLHQHPDFNIHANPEAMPPKIIDQRTHARVPENTSHDRR